MTYSGEKKAKAERLGAVGFVEKTYLAMTKSLYDFQNIGPPSSFFSLLKKNLCCSS